MQKFLRSRLFPSDHVVSHVRNNRGPCIVYSHSLLLLTSPFSQLFRSITDSVREVVRTVSSCEKDNWMRSSAFDEISCLIVVSNLELRNTNLSNQPATMEIPSHNPDSGCGL